MSRLGSGPAGFDEAQMSCRNSCIAGELKLAQPPALAPLAQKAAHWLRAIEHAVSLNPFTVAFKLPCR
jgi:hypothetical protein